MTKEQLGELILASQEQMYRMAKTLLYRDEDCSEAISETIVKAFSSIGTLTKDRYAKTWLIRILVNECYNQLRMQARQIPVEDPGAYLYEDGAHSDMAERVIYSDLYEALQKLPKERRLCMTLYYMEGYRVKEIAQILKTSENVVKKHLMNGRRELKQKLEDRR